MDRSHPDYLSIETPDNLYLNALDPKKPMFYLEMFWDAKRFCCSSGSPLLVHCNQGRSRSVAISFLCGIWRGIVAADLWENSFIGGGRGIDTFMFENWEFLTKDRSEWSGSPDPKYLLNR